MYTDIKQIQIKKLTLEIDKLLKQEARQKELDQIEEIEEKNYSILKRLFKRREYVQYCTLRH